jgi:hypothetical protein
MNKNDCERERFSSRSIGMMIIGVSLLLFVVGLIILPVLGFVFAVPLLIFGVTMLLAPESKVCQMVRKGLQPSEKG